MIAEAGGPELFNQIKEEYFSQHKDPFVKDVIKAVAEKDFSGLLEQVTSLEQQPGHPMRQLGHCSWKEAIAYVLAYEDTPKLIEVAKSLGD